MSKHSSSTIFPIKRQMIKVMEAMGKKLYQPGQFGEIRILNNISYVSDSQVEHMLDIIYPQSQQQRYPVIFNIHGGAFCMNSKEELYHDYGILLAGKQYAVVNINYTLSIHKVFPEQILDVMRALDYICTNAVKYQLDKNNIFVSGDSAGAYLATLLGCIMSNEILQKYNNWKPQVSIRAIASNCGMFDFNTVMQNDVKFPMKKSMIEMLFGTRDYQKTESFPYSSVLTYINNKFPPIYIMDTEVRSFDKEALRLEEAVKESGVDYKIHIFSKNKKLPHVFHIIPKYQEGTAVMEEMLSFFTSHLISQYT